MNGEGVRPIVALQRSGPSRHRAVRSIETPHSSCDTFHLLLNQPRLKVMRRERQEHPPLRQRQNVSRWKEENEVRSILTLTTTRKEKRGQKGLILLCLPECTSDTKCDGRSGSRQQQAVCTVQDRRWRALLGKPVGNAPNLGELEAG